MKGRRVNNRKEKLIKLIDSYVHRDKITYESLGKDLGVCRERVRQLLRDYGLTDYFKLLKGMLITDKAQKNIQITMQKTQTFKVERTFHIKGYRDYDVELDFILNHFKNNNDTIRNFTDTYCNTEELTLRQLKTLKERIRYHLDYYKVQYKKERVRNN